MKDIYSLKDCDDIRENLGLWFFGWQYDDKTKTLTILRRGQPFESVKIYKAQHVFTVLGSALAHAEYCKHNLNMSMSEIEREVFKLSGDYSPKPDISRNVGIWEGQS